MDTEFLSVLNSIQKSSPLPPLLGSMSSPPSTFPRFSFFPFCLPRFRFAVGSLVLMKLLIDWFSLIDYCLVSLRVMCLPPKRGRLFHVAL